MEFSIRLKALHHLLGDRGCLVGHEVSLGCSVHSAEAGAWPWSSSELGDWGLLVSLPAIMG